MADENYTVEKIVGHQPKTAKKATDAEKYNIKWEGYGDDENTWEPADNLNNAMIKEYWQSVKKNSDKKVSAEDVAKEISSEKKVKSEKKVTAKHEPEEEPQEYVVEAITSCLPRNASSDKDAKKYIIKWEGFSESEKTTEPADQIRESAPDAVADFWKARADAVAAFTGERDNKEESEEEVKLSSRGRKIKTIKPKVEPKPIKEPTQKKAKTTPSKSQKRRSPSKNTNTSPASQLDDTDVEDDVSKLGSLVGRVNVLETEKSKWLADRNFLKALCNREDMPAAVVAEIEEYLATSPAP